MEDVVKVVAPFESGYMLINVRDYNPEVHTLFTEGALPPAEEPPPMKAKKAKA
jgi:hypothetical protein